MICPPVAGEEAILIIVGWPLVGEIKGEGVVGSCTGWAGTGVAAAAGVGAGVMVGVDDAVAVGGISYFWI